jgi:hypothetical protein
MLHVTDRLKLLSFGLNYYFNPGCFSLTDAPFRLTNYLLDWGYHKLGIYFLGMGQLSSNLAFAVVF